MRCAPYTRAGIKLETIKAGSHKPTRLGGIHLTADPQKALPTPLQQLLIDLFTEMKWTCGLAASSISSTDLGEIQTSNTANNYSKLCMCCYNGQNYVDTIFTCQLAAPFTREKGQCKEVLMKNTPEVKNVNMTSNFTGDQQASGKVS